MSTATTASPLPTTAYPGLALGPTSSYVSGPGTHICESQIIASLPGRPTVLPSCTSNSVSKAGKGPTKDKPTITVPRLLPSPTYASVPSANISNTNILPKVGSIVLAKVLRVRTRQVDVGILCVGEVVGDERKEEEEEEEKEGGGGGGLEGKKTKDSNRFYGGRMNVCADEWPAVVRREDIRATEKDKVVCADGFRVGDVIRGLVISLGDQANYYLSTARNELGVILARSSEAGNLMEPVSWREFRDPLTGLREERKVAKPF